MTSGMHRSLDGTELHPGFVDECIECGEGFKRGEGFVWCGSCPCQEDGACVCPCYGCKFHCGACWCDPCQEASGESAIWGEHADPPP
jgi:hypothetical protein